MKLTESVEPKIEKLFEFCHNIATGIESGMFVKYEYSISKDYSTKYRKVQTALRNDENYDLRIAIITG
jgi:hypothetical protein